MPRSLVLVPPFPQLFAGTTPVGPGYPRTYTPQEMRAWAVGAERLDRVMDADRSLPAGQRRLDRWLATPRDQLPADARAAVDAFRKLHADPGAGIRGTLRSDGKVELEGGRHRAHYLVERGASPVPVWVDCPDAARLEHYRRQCDAHVARLRDNRRDRRNVDAPRIGRVALDEPRSRPPDRDRGG
jgi:hypothetical protein